MEYALLLPTGAISFFKIEVVNPQGEDQLTPRGDFIR
jgi:hypothetical protein